MRNLATIPQEVEISLKMLPDWQLQKETKEDSQSKLQD